MPKAEAPRSKESSSIAVCQPLPMPPRFDSTGTRASVKKTSPNSWSPDSVVMGRASTPGLVHVDQHQRQTLVPLRAGLGADQREQLVAVDRLRGPDLLAVDDVLVAVEDPGRADAGEVGAGAGLGEALAPDLLVAQDRADDVALLLLAAEHGDGGCEVGEAELVGATRGPRARHLLVVDGLHALGAAAAAPLLRPGDAGEAGLGLLRLPLTTEREGLVAVETLPEGGLAPLGRDRRLEVRPEFGAELLLFRGEAEIHGMTSGRARDILPMCLAHYASMAGDVTAADGADRRPS